jgi:hypothetical protein
MASVVMGSIFVATGTGPQRGKHRTFAEAADR